MSALKSEFEVKSSNSGATLVQTEISRMMVKILVDGNKLQQIAIFFQEYNEISTTEAGFFLTNRNTFTLPALRLGSTSKVMQQHTPIGRFTEKSFNVVTPLRNCDRRCETDIYLSIESPYYRIIKLSIGGGCKVNHRYNRLHVLRFGEERTNLMQ